MIYLSMIIDVVTQRHIIITAITNKSTNLLARFFVQLVKELVHRRLRMAPGNIMEFVKSSGFSFLSEISSVEIG